MIEPTAASPGSRGIDEADEHMRGGRTGEALKAYQAEWVRSGAGMDEVRQVWLLLSIANAAVRHDDHEEALAVLSVLAEDHSDSGIVVGNPLFHLLVGLACHGSREESGRETDNFARALICGGPEIFAGEDPEHLARIQQVLQPPAETGTWTGYRGCSRDLLNGSSGYLRELLAEKLGKPPPYGRDG